MAGIPHPVFVDNAPPEKASARSDIVYRIDSVSTVRATDLSGSWTISVSEMKAIYDKDTSDTTTEDDGDELIRDANGIAWVKRHEGGAVESVNGKTGSVLIEDIIHDASNKTTPDDTDEFALNQRVDSPASNLIRRLTWANLKSEIATYLASLTQTLTNKTISLSDNTISGLGTAATQNIGTSGANVPLLNAANTFGDKVTISSDTAFISHLDVVSADDTANNGPRASWWRNSPSPADSDNIGIFLFDANNASGSRKNFFYIANSIVTAAAGSEKVKTVFRGQNSGADTLMMTLGPGLQLGSPTGGDKGAGTINANDLYNDNVAVTCMALAEEFIGNGEIDLAKWDALVPDIVVPAHETEEPVMEDIMLEYNSSMIDADGDTVLTKKSKPWKQQATELHLVYDDQGNGIEALERPVFRKVIQPEQRIAREHVVAHLFYDMCKDGFDPRDPAKYIAKLKADQALPGMPTRNEWAARGHNGIGQGEMFMRKWLAMEMLALVVINHEDRLQVIEASLKA